MWKSKSDIVILELDTNNLTSLPPESVGFALNKVIIILQQKCGV